jgi:hypothetical protein
MTKTLTLMTAAVALLAIPACTQSQRATDLPPGKYESQTSSVNADGTKTTRSTTTEVDQDRDGDKSATTETKTTRDPKGLFNKQTSKTTTKTTEDRY